MVGHVTELSQDQRRELLALLTQERVDLHNDDEVLPELSEALRRQLSLSSAADRGPDLAEGFRRRMIRITEELGKDQGHAPGYYDFRSDRAIARELLARVSEQAKELSTPDGDGDFMTDFAKTFRTMSQDKRATWLHDAALAAGAVEPCRAIAQHAARQKKSSADDTAAQIAEDVAIVGVAYGLGREVARDAIARGAPSVGPAIGIRPKDLAAAAGPLGLVAGGVVAFEIRRRRKAAEKARDADVQVRRERQATQAVVTTCAYILGALGVE